MMIRGLSYDDRRLRDLPGEPLLATMVESAARCCGMGLIYEFWGVYEGLQGPDPEGGHSAKGHALWASAFCPEAAAEIVDFLQWRQEGWVMLCPTLTALWREKDRGSGASPGGDGAAGGGGVFSAGGGVPHPYGDRGGRLQPGGGGRFPLPNMKRRW